MWGAPRAPQGGSDGLGPVLRGGTAGEEGVCHDLAGLAPRAGVARAEVKRADRLYRPGAGIDRRAVAIVAADHPVQHHSLNVEPERAGRAGTRPRYIGEG